MSPAGSLRTRLLVAVLLATALVWTVLAIGGYHQARRQLQELMDANLQQSAELLAAQLTEGDDGEEIELEHARQIHRYTRKLVFQVWEGQRLRLKSATAPTDRLSPGDEGFGFAEVDGHRWRVYSAWAGRKRALIQVGEPIEAREQVGREISEHLLAPLLIALPLLGLALAMAIRRGLKPLADLARQVAHREPGRLEPLDVRRAPLEVRPLVDQLNHLFARISQSLLNERRFTADASHELRTPVAAIAVQAQVARDANDPEERRHALEQVLAGCARSAHLIEQLLTLARVDSAAASETQEQCDLACVAREVLAEMAPSAHAQGIELELTSPEKWVVSGREAWLRVLLRNLVDNGVRYGHSGGHVRVEVRGSDEDTVLAVCDDGPGIEASERQRVMDRFYRLPGTGESGSGLGLSIVGRIAECSDATVELADAEGGEGLRVVVRFPAAVGRPPTIT